MFGSPPAGTLGFSNDGSFSYMPVQYFNGIVTFQFLVLDGYNPPIGPYVVSITVNQVNNPPLLSTIPDMNVLIGTRLAFWASATDPDFPYGEILTYSIDGTLPSGASINPQSGFFKWDVSISTLKGDYIFTFRVTDSQGLSASQPVKVSVYYPKFFLSLIVR
jgi:hypothetical protein